MLYSSVHAHCGSYVCVMCSTTDRSRWLIIGLKYFFISQKSQIVGETAMLLLMSNFKQSYRLLQNWNFHLRLRRRKERISIVSASRLDLSLRVKGKSTYR